MKTQKPEMLNPEVNQGTLATGKKAWLTPKLEVYSNSIIESGALPLVEGLDILGNLIS